MPVSGSSFTLHCTHGSFGGVGLAGVTYRQIHSLTKPQTSYASVYPGNSGQPSSPFYSNNLNRWRNAKTHKLYLNWDEIETIETAIITTTTRHMKAQQIL